jgi:hypothetical protein
VNVKGAQKNKILLCKKGLMGAEYSEWLKGGLKKAQKIKMLLCKRGLMAAE